RLLTGPDSPRMSIEQRGSTVDKEHVQSQDEVQRQGELLHRGRRGIISRGIAIPRSEEYSGVVDGHAIPCVE
ncbi:MAG: hypothetical protein KAQ74_05475, partial [Dehalococcoidia bacterium]|nr:hypothetical protein [Dehalococcoidia bacterium]